MDTSAETDDRTNCVLDRINAMLSHEETAARCSDYLTVHVDATDRRKMVEWCITVVDALDLSRETVGIAFSILDRYLSSGGGDSAAALQCKQTFQKAALASLYISVKLYEPGHQLGLELLVKLCRGIYSKSSIASAEMDILTALQWRVYTPFMSPIDYVRQFLDLIPECKGDAHEIVIKNSIEYLITATSDIYFSTCETSHVALACLSGAMEDSLVLTSSEKHSLWQRLYAKLQVDTWNAIREVEQKLLAKSTSSKRRNGRVCAILSRHASSRLPIEQQSTSSPVTVM